MPEASSCRRTRASCSRASVVARFYRDWIDGFVFDERDRELVPRIEALGLPTRVLDTMMVDAEVSERVARAALELAESLR